MLGQFYEKVGVGVGFASPDDKTPPQPVISVVFPLREPVRPDVPDHDDNFEDRFMSIDTAKSLISQLQEAIDELENGMPF